MTENTSLSRSWRIAFALIVAFTGAAAGWSQPVDAQTAVEPSSFAASEGTEGSVYRLYCAYFLREPDSGGFDFWVEQRNQGSPLEDISEFFARSDEFQATYGPDVSDEDFVRLIYANILGRDVEPAGFEFWTGALADGMRRGKVMLFFSDSAEYRQRVVTVGCSKPSPPVGEIINTQKIHVLRARDGGGSSPTDTLVRGSSWSYNTVEGRLTARTFFGFGALGEQITARAYLESGFKPHRSSASFVVDLDWNGRVSGFNSFDSYSAGRVIIRIRERVSGRVVFEHDVLDDGVGAGYQGIAAAQLEGSVNQSFPLPTLDTSVIYVAEVELQCHSRVAASLGTTVCDMRPELFNENTNLDYGVTLNYWAIEFDKGICPDGVVKDGCVNQ